MRVSNINIPYLMLLVAGLMVLLILALIVATVSVKSVRAARERRHKARRGRVEPLLERFLTYEEDEESTALSKTSPRDKDRYLAPLMVERMEVLRGADRERISALACELGLVDRYVSDLDSRSRWRRARAAEFLGYFGDSKETPSISALLGDEDETVRAVAARALARIGSPEAVEALTRTLGTPSELTRLRVAENLDRVGQAAVPPLVALLEEASGPEQQEQPHGPIFASQVLGGLRAREARPALRLAVAEGKSPDVRAQSARALGRIGDLEDLPLLVEAAGDEAWPVRVQAASALGMIGEPSTIPVLEGLVSDREWWVRYASAGALANMGRSGEDALILLLGSPDPYARDRAAATLERRGLTRRFVRQLPLDNARGERARGAISALIRAGIVRHLSYLLSELPEGEERSALEEMLGKLQAQATPPVEPEARAEPNGTVDIVERGPEAGPQETGGKTVEHPSQEGQCE